MIACPFYIPTFKYSSAFDPRILKCVFCYDTRLKHGKPPACVEACPQEALLFGKRDDLIKIGRRRIDANKDQYLEHIYGEYEAGGTSWLYLSNVPFEKIGFNMEIPHAPILDSVKNFLGIVPMVLTIWPALFAGFHLLATRKDHHQQTTCENTQEKS
jgi:formate dehydrogenase iron-sulfur subunit